jgi:hypothetical protein
MHVNYRIINLNFLLYCKVKWNNKANMGEVVFAISEGRFAKM